MHKRHKKRKEHIIPVCDTCRGMGTLRVNDVPLILELCPTCKGEGEPASLAHSVERVVAIDEVTGSSPV